MRRVIGIVVVLTLGIGLAFNRAEQDKKTDQRIQASMNRLAEILGQEQHEKHVAFINANIDAAHEHAMSVAYEPPRRRRAAQFDAQKYANAVMENLALRVRTQRGGDNQLQACITNLQIAVEQAAKNGEFADG